MLKRLIAGIALTGLMGAMANAEPPRDQAPIDELKMDPQRPEAPLPRGEISILRPAGLLLATFDRDGDYKISRAELTAGSSVAFGRADKNKSGSLSLIELQNWRLAVLGSQDAMPGNGSFDGNYDSQVTKAEFADALTFEFENADRDEDNQVSFHELVRIVDMGRRGRRGVEGRSGDEGDGNQGRRPRR